MTPSNLRFVNYQPGDWSHWLIPADLGSDDTTGALDREVQPTRKKRRRKWTDAELDDPENWQYRTDALRHREADMAKKATKKAKRDPADFMGIVSADTCAASPEMIAVRDYRMTKERFSMNKWYALCERAGLRFPPDRPAVRSSERAEGTSTPDEVLVDCQKTPDVLPEEHDAEPSQNEEELPYHAHSTSTQPQQLTADEYMRSNRTMTQAENTAKAFQIVKREAVVDGHEVIDLCGSDDEAPAGIKVESPREHSLAVNTLRSRGFARQAAAMQLNTVSAPRRGPDELRLMLEASERAQEVADLRLELHRSEGMQ
ncbi:hypothetical protein LTR17_014441 [Elasticomyces elasticus]|nr:hypothetical protein LTR17_014441 [Elasticomyces elasticus]